MINRALNLITIFAITITMAACGGGGGGDGGGEPAASPSDKVIGNYILFWIQGGIEKNARISITTDSGLDLGGDKIFNGIDAVSGKSAQSFWSSVEKKYIMALASDVANEFVGFAYDIGADGSLTGGVDKSIGVTPQNAGWTFDNEKSKRFELGSWG